MAITSGFFDSLGGDRLYNADAFNQLFDGIISDGIISPVGGGFFVTPGTGMQVIVDSGRAWFMRSWLDSNAAVTLDISPSVPGTGRYDIIALEFNKTNGVRENNIVVVEGITSGTPVLPALIDVTDHKQYPLANVFIPAASTDISQGDIENRIGTVDCPLATGILQQFTTDDMLLQWYSDFYDWFNNLQNELDSNQVTNLQNQLDTLFGRNRPERNFLINGRFQVSQRIGTTVEVTTEEFPLGAPDRWLFNMASCGGITPTTETREDFGINRRWYKLTATTARTPLVANSVALLQQRIEGQRVVEILAGSPEAKEVTYSMLFRSNVIGTYIVEIVNKTAGVRISRSFDYLASETTQKVSFTYDRDLVNELSAGNTEALRLNIWLAAGDTYVGGGALQTGWGTLTGQRAFGQVNVMASVGNYVSFTDAQLEVGSEATPYERRSDEKELKDCQKYYYEHWDRYVSIYTNGSPPQEFCVFDLPTRMRVIPTLEFFATQEDIGSGWIYDETFFSNEGNEEQVALRSVPLATGQGSTGYTYWVRFITFKADAEL